MFEFLNDLIAVSPMFIVALDIMLYLLFIWWNWATDGEELEWVRSPVYYIIEELEFSDEKATYFLAFMLVYGFGGSIFGAMLRSELNFNFIPLVIGLVAFVLITIGMRYTSKYLKRIKANRSMPKKKKEKKKFSSNDVNLYE